VKACCLNPNAKSSKVRTLSTHSPFLEVVQHTPGADQFVSLYRRKDHEQPVIVLMVDQVLELEPELARLPIPLESAE
jgi:hypothetical protein